MDPAIVLTWLDELTALFWLLAAAVVLLYLRCRAQGHAGFTDRNWWFLLAVHAKKSLPHGCGSALRLWLAVVLVGLGMSFYVLPYGLAWFFGTLLLVIAGILFITPK